MSFNRALIFGSIVGAAGAALWAAIAYFANLEIGWLAWGIGAAVGFACVQGAGYGSRLIGTSAAIITLIAILAGKYAAVELFINNEFGGSDAIIQESINEETLTSYLADKIIEDIEQGGGSVEWPAEVDLEIASIEAKYPAEIWRSAEEQWNALSQEVKQEWREDVETRFRADLDDLRKQSFLQSFGLFDLIFFGLALYSAFSVGQSGGLDEDTEDDTETDDPDSDDTVPALQ